MRLNRYMLSLLSAALLAGCTSGAKQGAAGSTASPLAEADRPTASSVRSLLGAYEAVPNREAWLKMPGDVAGALSQIATDKNELPSRRARACEVLGWFGTTGLSTLRTTLADSTLPGVVRMGAVTGLSRALSPTEAQTLLATTIADPEPMVRFRTVMELKRLGTPEALATLQSRTTVETDASVQRMLKQSLETPAAQVAPGAVKPSAGSQANPQ